MSVYKWLLDAGHSGVDAFGQYLTAPAKQHQFPDGLLIQEGVINRKICKPVIQGLQFHSIDYAVIHDEVADTSLVTRVQRADAIYAHDKRCIYVSIHSNASPDSKSPGSGLEIFTSKGQNRSDKVANIFCEVYKKHFPEYPFRSDKVDGDADKEADFYVLRKTDCPALLIENFFFDNRHEAELLLSEEGQQRIAACILDCIETVEKLKPI